MNRSFKGIAHIADAVSRVLTAHPEPESGRPLNLSRALPRIAFGVTAALAAVAATIFVFGPFSDLSVRQLAAGPNGTERGPDGKPIVVAATGRSWGTDYQRRVGAASAAPLPHIDPSLAATARVATAK